MPQFLSIQSPDKKFILECCPAIGGSITAFRHEGRDLFRPYDPAAALVPRNVASFPLTPYSNRIINGKLLFAGETMEVGPLDPGEPHQLHGDGWLQPWQTGAADEREVTLTLATSPSAGTPYAYEARQVYTLDDNGLTIAMEITNRAARALPFGLGHHPYFPRNDQTVLTASLPKVWDSRNIVPRRLIDTPPKWDFSRGLAVSDANFGPPSQGVQGTDLVDHCFTGWDRRARIDWPDRGLSLEMTADPVFPYFVLYIPDGKPFICAEAVTNINDGFNLAAQGIEDTGMRVLQPGESMGGAMRFKLV